MDFGKVKRTFMNKTLRLKIFLKTCFLRERKGVSKIFGKKKPKT